jgi:GNAT superfamily N-acetyltransferase
VRRLGAVPPFRTVRMSPHASLAARIPDLPRWVEARALLLDGRGDVTGVRESDALACVVRDLDAGDVFVIGEPPLDAVREAAHATAHDGDVIVANEQADRVASVLPGWRRSQIRLHTLPDQRRLPAPSEGPVALLDPDTLDAIAMPAELREELRGIASYSPIAVSLAAGVPVAFCYAGAITESLWDVSIDTLPAHRRHGHASRCAAHLVRHLHVQGLRPVWAALEENPASWRLADTLGFVVVDALTLFAPPAPAAPE